ncbi:hypothetical protein L7F22_063181 [Adiantum nelumboides]|nr:hypothetical protein [Adiantum nelumboides]
MASLKDQSTPSASGDAGRDHNEDFGREYGPPRPTQTEQREMERRKLIGDATNMMLSFAKNPKLAKYMIETSFQDVHGQWKKITPPPPKPALKKPSDHKQYSEKELEEIAERINDVSFQLKLPDTWKIHNAFHVSLLKPLKGDVPDYGEPDGKSEVKENEEILVPKQILAHKDTKNKGTKISSISSISVQWRYNRAVGQEAAFDDAFGKMVDMLWEPSTFDAFKPWKTYHNGEPLCPGIEKSTQFARWLLGTFTAMEDAIMDMFAGTRGVASQCLTLHREKSSASLLSSPAAHPLVLQHYVIRISCLYSTATLVIFFLSTGTFRVSLQTVISPAIRFFPVHSDVARIMSDHVALTVDEIAQSGKRAELESDNQAGSSELVAKPASSGSETSRKVDAGIAESSERSRNEEIENQKVNPRGGHDNYSSLTSEAFCIEHVVNEEALPLLEGDQGKVDDGHVVVPIESQPHLGKKDIKSPSFAECRICQEEDDISNLESPCACSGSLKFAHRKCVQHWCNEKGDTLCEICQKPFEGGYAMPQQGRTDSVGLDIGTGWDIASGQPRLFALADHHFLEGDYDEYAGSHAHSAACFRSIALILVALLLLRHIISMTGVGEDEDLTTFFMLSLVRAAGFLIPCYIMARAMNALQIRRQQQEAAMAAAAEVTHLIQTGRIQAVVAAEP